MHPLAQILLSLCAVAVTIVLVPAMVALRRSAQRAERVLAILEEELRPLAGETRALTEDLRALVREANQDLERIGAVAERAHDIAEGLVRVLTALGGLTRAGQLVGVAAGLKRGIDVFVHRMRKAQGDDHE